MADFTLGPARFPVGTTVGAYPRTAFVGDTGPLAVPVDTAVVDANLEAEFTGLAFDTQYWAAAQVDGSWRRVSFRTDEDTSLEAATRGYADAAVAVVREGLPYALLDTGLFSGVNIDAALTQAKTDLGAAGGRVVLPAGSLEVLAPPSFAESRSIVLEGAAGLSAGAVPATRLTYKGTGARGIDARSSFGFGLRDMELRSDQAGFSGDLIDFEHSIVQDAAYAALERCRISSAHTNCVLVNLENAILLGLANCYLAGGSIGIQGRGAASYSNSIKVDNVTFFGQGVAPIKNPGEGWTVISCGFEALAGGVAGAILCDQAAKGLAVHGGWCGDATAGTGTWFDLSGEGLLIAGTRIGGGVNGVVFSATSIGCSVLGASIAQMTNGVTFTAGCQDVTALGIGFNLVTNPVVVGGTPRGVWQDGTGQTHGGITQFKQVTDYIAASTGAAILRSFAAGAATERLHVQANGTLNWSSGAAALDTTFGRLAANVAGVGADDCLRSGVAVTGSRPSASAVGNGSMFYDDTLNKPIWSDGTTWRDATGTAV